MWMWISWTSANHLISHHADIDAFVTEIGDLSPCLPSRSSHGAVGSGYDVDQSGVPSKRPRLLEEFTPQAIRLILQEPEQQPLQQPPPEQLFPNELVADQLLEVLLEPLYAQSPPAATPPLMFVSGSESVGAPRHLAEAHRQLDCVLLEQSRIQCLYMRQLNFLYGRVHAIMLSLTVPLTNPPSPRHVLWRLLSFCVSMRLLAYVLISEQLFIIVFIFLKLSTWFFRFRFQIRSRMAGSGAEWESHGVGIGDDVWDCTFIFDVYVQYVRFVKEVWCWVIINL